MRDFGIRGVDLAFALLEPWDLVIFIDATQRCGEPGTLYTIEPDLTALGDGAIEAHTMTPERVLASARAMGAQFGRVLVVGCEPESLASMGLSPRVGAALDAAEAMVERLVGEETASALESRLRA